MCLYILARLCDLVSKRSRRCFGRTESSQLHLVYVVEILKTYPHIIYTLYITFCDVYLWCHNSSKYIYMMYMDFQWFPATIGSPPIHFCRGQCQKCGSRNWSPRCSGALDVSWPPWICDRQESQLWGPSHRNWVEDVGCRSTIYIHITFPKVECLECTSNVW